MAGVAAVRNGKTKEAANVAAEVVRLGWGVLVNSVSLPFCVVFWERQMFITYNGNNNLEHE